MRTPKPLYAHERMIYHPELLTCPHCGDLLVTCNYLAWDKTVQRLDRVLSVASRPGRCPHAMCVGSRLRLLSAEGQRLAPAGSTYGYDVVVHIGWWRQEARATYREIHAALASRVRISESHVGYLYQQVYLPLLACHERQHRDRLAQIAQQQGGLIVALDGLAPQGGEPQIWFIRELSSGLTLRSGWLCAAGSAHVRSLSATAEAPGVAHPGRAQRQANGLGTGSGHGLPPQSLSVLSGPLSAQPGRTPRRGRCRLQGGAATNGARAGRRLDPSGTPHGVRPPRRLDGDRLVAQSARNAHGARLPTPTCLGTLLTAPEAKAEEVITQLFRHTRYLLTLKGRPPFRLAGLETYERLHNVAPVESRPAGTAL